MTDDQPTVSEPEAEAETLFWNIDGHKYAGATADEARAAYLRDNGHEPDEFGTIVPWSDDDDDEELDPERFLHPNMSEAMIRSLNDVVLDRGLFSNDPETVLKALDEFAEVHGWFHDFMSGLAFAAEAPVGEAWSEEDKETSSSAVIALGLIHLAVEAFQLQVIDHYRNLVTGLKPAEANDQKEESSND